MTPSTLFITGTDTGVGKTIVTAALSIALARPAEESGTPTSVAVDKPVQTGAATGEPMDTDVVHALAPSCACSEGLRLQRPMAPVPAARLEGARLPSIHEQAARIRSIAEGFDHLLIEGAGGALVQLDDGGSTLVELAAALGGPSSFVVVCRSGLGTLNHTELTLEVLGHRGLHVAGVVIGSWPEDPDEIDRSNRRHLSRLGVRLLGAIPAGASRLEPALFRQRAPTWFDALP